MLILVRVEHVLSALRNDATTVKRPPLRWRFEPSRLLTRKGKMMLAKQFSEISLPAALSAAQPLRCKTDETEAGDWLSYPFNYNGAPSPPLREINDISGMSLKVDVVEHFLTYHFHPSPAEAHHGQVESIDCPLMVLALSTSNAGHAMSEIISFINFVRQTPAEIKIGVSEAFMIKLPLIFEFVQRLYESDRIIVLRRNTVYHLRRAWIRRENHFNASCNWMDLDYESDDNVLCFRHLDEHIKFDDDPYIVQEQAHRIYEQCRDRYTLHDRVMLLKTVDSRNLTTPGRALLLDNVYKAKIAESGFHLASIEQFSCIEEYICTLYHARQLVLSYGSTTCTNRFFVKPACDVIVIANQAYQFEYEYPVSTGAHWHVRHSHLLPVRRQRVIIGHNNVFTENDVDNLLRLAAR